MGRREELLRETAERVGEALVVPADVRDRAAVDAAFARAAAERGPLFALVANAGIGGPNEAGPEDRFDDLVETNLTGTYSSARAAERHLADGPGARHLVLMASILGRFGVPGLHPATAPARAR